MNRYRTVQRSQNVKLKINPEKILELEIATARHRIEFKKAFEYGELEEEDVNIC